MRMLWLGLLVVVGLLLSYSRVTEADEDADQQEEVNETKQKVLNPLRFIEVPPAVNEIIDEIPKENVIIDIIEKEKYLEEHNQLLKDEAVEHIRQDAEDSAQNVRDLYVQDIPDINDGVVVQVDEVGKDDVLEAEHVGRHVPKDEVEGADPTKVDDSKWVGKQVVTKSYEEALEKARKQALKKVELLRRSDRGKAEKGENKTKRVYIKPLPHNHGLPVAHVVHEKETGFVQEIVFLNSESHAHVAHQHKDYATLHDEF